MLKYQELESNMDVYRAKVPGGWLVLFKGFDNAGLTFYPDPNHAWDGNSLP